MGLLEPQKGSILIDNIKLTQETNDDWQSKISHVPQKIFLSDNSFLENIAFGKEIEKIDIEKVMTSAKKSQIHDFIINSENGYNENVGEKIREYLKQESSKGNNAQGSNDAAKINVGIHGATGRLGSLITKQCDDASTPNVTGYKIGRDLQINEHCNVIIDVTLPEGTKALI